MGPDDEAPPRLVELSGIPALLEVPVPTLPRRGGETTASSSAVVSAGGRFALLVAAARRGLPIAYAGAHGTGPFGEAVRAALTAAGVQLLTPPAPAADSPGTIALSEPDRTTSLVHLPGPRLVPHLDGVVVGRNDLLHLTGDGLHDPAAAHELLVWLARQPLATVLLYDPGERGHLLPAALRARLLARVDWWVGSTAAVHAATGMDPAAGAGMLAALTRCGVLVTDASSVVLAEHRTAAVRLTGGGTHTEVVAAFAAGLARGRTPAAALAASA